MGECGLEAIKFFKDKHKGERKKRGRNHAFSYFFTGRFNQKWDCLPIKDLGVTNFRGKIFWGFKLFPEQCNAGRSEDMQRFTLPCMYLQSTIISVMTKLFA